MSSLASAISAAPPNALNASTAAFWLRIGQTLGILQGLLSSGATLVWNNPGGATPQQVCDSFGTNAAALFQLSSLLCTLIGSITGTTPNPVPAGWTVIANSDGTVTLTPPAS